MDAHQQGMDPHYPPYADNNLNQKPAGNNTYIYNSEATYITSREQTMSQHIDMNQQWAANENIQYQGPDQGYVQEVNSQYQPNVVVTQDNQSYILQANPNAPYITQHQTIETQEQQLYTMAQSGQQTTYVYQQANIQETYDGQVTTETQYAQEFRVEEPQVQSDTIQEHPPQAPVETPSTTEIQIEEVSENQQLPETEVVEDSDGIVVNVLQPDDTPEVTEPQGNVHDSSTVEVSEVVDESQMEGAEVIEADPIAVVQEEPEVTDTNVPVETDKTPTDEVTPSLTDDATPPCTADNTTFSSTNDITSADESMEETKQEEFSNQDGFEPVSEENSMEVMEEDSMKVAEEGGEQSQESGEPTHTPEQALGAMYEFSEEIEDNSAILRKPYETQVTNNQTIAKLEDNTQDLGEGKLEDQGQEPPEETVEKEPVAVQKVKKEKGRKLKDVPVHILGVDITKPVDNLPNGKSYKPRLGVKVPTRTLTSHIVSKAEIEQEIVDRGRRKMEAKGQEAFAKKLTQRLAKQIIGDEQSSQNGAEPKAIIENNSDLLAILEGDGDDTKLPVIEKKSTSADPEDLNNLEREIALQQLKELPFASPKTKFDKAKGLFPAKPPKLEPENLPKKKQQESPKKPEVTKKISASTKSDLNSSLEVEPQIKVNMALKTYSRKRKSIDPPETSPEKRTAVVPTMLVASPAPATPTKIDCPITTAAYVTKSSRVIKKKVIWDPDDELPSAVSRTTAKTTPKNEPPPEQNKSPTKPLKTYEKNEKSPDQKITDTPKVQEKKLEKTPAKEKVEKKEEKEKTPKNKEIEKTPKIKEIEKTPKSKEKPVDKDKITPKKQTPVSHKKKVVKTLKAKKTMSEVDRLLGDEGAIRMLYEMQNDGEGNEEKRKSKRGVISVESTFKELAKQANEIKSSLVNSTNNDDSPLKSLRKKDTSSPAPPPTPPHFEKPDKKQQTPMIPAPVLNRQKSKDSTRSSLHTPPASPAPSFEASYLIRRRSSSSISDLEDGDLDSADDSDVEIRIPKRASKPSHDGPKIKKHKKNTTKTEKPETTVESESDVSTAKAAKFDHRLGPFNQLSVKKFNKQVTVTLQLQSTNGFLTIEVLDELTLALTKLSKERDCNVVMVRSSQEKVFCMGLDYKSLVVEKESDRKAKCSKLATIVCDFLKALLHFPKVIVVGIQGECAGLGVTMLPLFDLVVASDKATFSTNYSALGCVAESGFLLTTPHITNHGLAAELLYSNQKLTADDVNRRGLVSKLCWPEKYQETIKNLLASIAKGSKQSLEATKKQLRRGTLKSTEVAIDLMSKQLIDQWSSNECQKSFDKIGKVE